MNYKQIWYDFWRDRDKATAEGSSNGYKLSTGSVDRAFYPAGDGVRP